MSFSNSETKRSGMKDERSMSNFCGFALFRFAIGGTGSVTGKKDACAWPSFHTPALLRGHAGSKHIYKSLESIYETVFSHHGFPYKTERC